MSLHHIHSYLCNMFLLFFSIKHFFSWKTQLFVFLCSLHMPLAVNCSKGDLSEWEELHSSTSSWGDCCSSALSCRNGSLRMKKSRGWVVNWTGSYYISRRTESCILPIRFILSPSSIKLYPKSSYTKRNIVTWMKSLVNLLYKQPIFSTQTFLVI